MVKYRKGEEKDQQDLLDFINYVFSLEHGSTNFRELLPKIYGENCHMENIHHLLVEQDRIKAAIALYSSRMTVGKHTIKMGYIGSISVHPYERGKGYMKELMKKVQKEIVEEKYDLVAISGQRQRYEYFGYYRGGNIIQYQVNQDNLRHYFYKKFLDSPMTKEEILAEMELSISLQENKEDSYVEAIYQIYQNRIITGREREEFYDIMQSFHTELYAVTMHGVCIGYINFDYEEDYINEFELIDMGLLPYVLEMLMEYTGTSVLGIKTTLLDKEKNSLLKEICERYTIGQAQMYHILNYPAVFQLLLEAKNQVKALQDGCFRIKIKGAGSYKICVEQGNISVEKTGEKADILMNEEQIIRILLSTDYGMACTYGEVPGLENAPAGWFPLSLAVETADTL